MPAGYVETEPLGRRTLRERPVQRMTCAPARVRPGRIGRRSRRTGNGFRRDHFKEGMAAMKYRPLIGINTDYRAAAKGRTPHSFIQSGYFECMLAANALPVIIPPMTRESDLTPILERLDGVMLTGGDDLDPRKMGLSPHPAVTMVTERRELADRLLCKLVQQRRMPVLGIGLGMQELNVVCGGGLFLHLPEDFPKGI